MLHDLPARKGSLRPPGAGLVAVLSTLVALPASAGVPSNPTALEVATRLLDEAPDRWLALEAILGSLERDVDGWEGLDLPLMRYPQHGPIEEIQVGLDIDIYHEEPTKPDPRLDFWRVTFREGGNDVLELLRTRLGPPTRVGGQSRFGRLFLDPLDGERSILSWHASEPEWAKPTRSPAEAEALQKDLAALFSRTPISRSAIEKIFGELTRDPDWNCDHIVQPTWQLQTCPAGAGLPDKITVRFDVDRPLPATAALLAALGFREPVVISPDIHRTSHEVVESATLRPPRLGGLRVNVSVADEGLVVTDRKDGASPVWVATELKVRSIRIGK